MFKKDLESSEDNIPEKEEVVEEEPEKKTSSSNSRKKVKSLWLSPINGKVLVVSGSDYRLVPAGDWPRKVDFEISSSKFGDFEEPLEFNHDKISNEIIWKAGIVDRYNVQYGGVQQAISVSGHTQVEVNELIKFLKGS